MKKSFFKCALIVMSLAALQACNDRVIAFDILDPEDVPLDVEILPEDDVEEAYEIIDDVADDSEVGVTSEL